MNTNEISRSPADAATAGASPSTPRHVLALTQDASLGRALEELATLQVAVVQVADPESLVEQLLTAGPAIALIDAQSLTRPLELLIDQLVSQFPDLRLLVAGHALEQTQLAARIAQGQVFRFVHKPASAQRLKLFVDAANRPLESSRVAPVASPEPVRELPSRPVPAAPATSGPETPRGGPASKLPMMALVAGAAAVAIVAGVLLTRGGDDEATTARPAAPPTAAPSRPQSAEIESLIRSADQAFAALRFVSREGNGAAELYQKVLQLDPQDTRARSGFTRSIDFAVRNAETSFTEGRLAEAESLVAMVLAVSPGNSRVGFLQSQLTRERERSAVDENRRLGAEARQEKLRGLLTQANDRLRRGALIEPERESAFAALGAAQDVAPNDSEVRALRDRLGARLVEAAGQKLDAGDVAGARTLLDAAGSLGSANAAIVQMRRRADEASAKPVARATTPAAAPAAGTAVVPESPPVSAPVVAPAPVTAAPAVAPPAAAAARSTDTLRIYARTELTLLRSVEVEYPQRALAASIAGWVDVEFTIGTDGAVKNVMVLAAEPKNIFDYNATQALRRWRYAPVVENGTPVEARTRMRLRFTPPADR